MDKRQAAMSLLEAIKKPDKPKVNSAAEAFGKLGVSSELAARAMRAVVETMASAGPLGYDVLSVLSDNESPHSPDVEYTYPMTSLIQEHSNVDERELSERHWHMLEVLGKIRPEDHDRQVMIIRGGPRPRWRKW